MRSKSGIAYHGHKTTRQLKYDVAKKDIYMYGEHNPYATLSRRQVALFERNPVCALCYRVCMDLCEEYGGINFDLLDSIRTADDLCGLIIQNAWSLDGVEHYFDMVNNRLGHSKPAIACTFATVCVTLTCMDNLPEPVYQLAHDMRGLIIGEGNDLYDSLKQSAYRQDIVIDATAYGEPPPEPSLLRENEQLRLRTIELEDEITKYKNLLDMKDQQAKGGTTINNYGTYIAELNNDIHDNHNCPIYAVPASEESGVRNQDSGRVKGEARTKKLFMTDGAEDMQRTEEECNRFLNYLAEHHLRQRQVDCYKDNPINKAIVCFCVKWKRLKMIDKPSPAAVYRFLTETCHLECAAETDAITASLGRLLKADYDRDTFDDVENYF